MTDEPARMWAKSIPLQGQRDDVGVEDMTPSNGRDYAARRAKLAGSFALAAG